VSEKSPSAPSANGKPPKEAVIRRLEAAEETAQERLIKKHVPAWVVSGAAHVAVIALAILVMGERAAVTKPTDAVIVTTADKSDEPEDQPLTNEDLGFDPKIEAALPEIERIDSATVDGIVTQDNVGLPDVTTTDTQAMPPPGFGATDFTTSGATGEAGNFTAGDGGRQGTLNALMAGRSASTRSRLVRVGGGSEESERAVGLGLAWLARQQKKDGGWEFDQGSKDERAAATGLALLPFLAAGETHKPSKDKGEERRYMKTVAEGLGFLMRACAPAGATAGRMSANMYAQGIASIALCEAYGMTKDPALRPYAQAAINYIQRAQGPNGSWGYAAAANGDTSIVGWQVQALQAAKLSKDLIVDERVIKKAVAFLNHAAAGSRKSMYGYADSAGAQPGRVGAEPPGHDRRRGGAGQEPADARRRAAEHVLLLLRHAGRPLLRGRRLEELERGAAEGRRHPQGRHARLAHRRADQEGRRRQDRELGQRGRHDRHELRPARHHGTRAAHPRGVLPPPAAVQARRRRPGDQDHRRR
jgi:hypothetical protein